MTGSCWWKISESHWTRRKRLQVGRISAYSLKLMYLCSVFTNQACKTRAASSVNNGMMIPKLTMFSSKYIVRLTQSKVKMRFCFWWKLSTAAVVVKRKIINCVGFLCTSYINASISILLTSNISLGPAYLTTWGTHNVLLGLCFYQSWNVLRICISAFHKATCTVCNV